MAEAELFLPFLLRCVFIPFPLCFFLVSQLLILCFSTVSPSLCLSLSLSVSLRFALLTGATFAMDD